MVTVKNIPYFFKQNCVIVSYLLLLLFDGTRDITLSLHHLLLNLQTLICLTKREKDKR